MLLLLYLFIYQQMQSYWSSFLTANFFFKTLIILIKLVAFGHELGKMHHQTSLKNTNKITQDVGLIWWEVAFSFLCTSSLFLQINDSCWGSQQQQQQRKLVWDMSNRAGVRAVLLRSRRITRRLVLLCNPSGVWGPPGSCHLSFHPFLGTKKGQRLHPTRKG